MQVVHPYPTVKNPAASRSSVRPALSRYSVTTLEPGAREVLTQGLRVRPRRRASRAMTDNRSIGYAEWLADSSVFMRRAQLWNETER